MKGLRGKTAIVTGAAHGIGKAIAMRLCREGVRVAFSDIDEDAALETAEEAYQEGFEVVVAQADVANTPQVHEMIEGVAAHWGQIDILVANAGIMDRAPFLEMSDKFWDRVHGINLKGAFVCGQAVARLMVALKTEGRIINVASNSGIFGGRGRAAYGASKAGLINLTQTMAIELAEHGIRVNAVAPGPTKTGPHMPEKPWPSVAARMPLGRFGTPEEIAAVAAFLASDESSFVTGHVYGADGGYTTAGIMEG